MTRSVACPVFPFQNGLRSAPTAGRPGGGGAARLRRPRVARGEDSRVLCSLLVEPGLIFRRSDYAPLSLVECVEGQRVWLAAREATLAERAMPGFPANSIMSHGLQVGTVFPDISDASWLGKYPLIPAETGHYHYEPLGEE